MSVRTTNLRSPRFRSRPWYCAAIVAAAALVACLSASIKAASPQAPKQGQQQPISAVTTPAATPSPATAKPDPKKAKEAYQLGVAAEKAGDWQTAYTDYSDAAELSPNSREYVFHREIAKSRLVQARVDAAERDAISGRLDEARRELLSASYIDPSDEIVRERLAELSAAEPDQPRTIVTEPDLTAPPKLAFQTGTKTFDFRGDTESAYEELAKQFGVEVAFDVDLRGRQIRFRATDVDFPTAARLLGSQTATFWRPLSAHLFFVTDDTAQKRRDYDVSAVRTILLPAAETPEQMTELLRVVRDVTGITRSQLDTRTHTITLRASPQSLAVATDLLDDLEQPSGELVLEIEVLEIDRTSALNLGITPPSSATIYSLSPQQIQEAQSSFAGLVSVITQVFGTPSALSGLTATQITSLLGTGTVSPATLIPPVIAIGGGKSTFLVTLPGAAANFAQMLSVVQQGRRILLRAKDGQPATFFVGERYPVSLATFSNSLAGPGGNVPSIVAENFPATNYAAGQAPSFVATGSLRDNGTNDIIVANSTDNTVAVLLGNGDGTFPAPVPYATNTDPVWIATGQFNANTAAPVHDEFLDVAVADNTANVVSVLLGNGDGTLQPKFDLAVGNKPVSVVAANFHNANPQNIDLAVANQGDNTISILQGNGDGTFLPAVNFALAGGFNPTALAAADFNGDGDVDLAVTSAGSNLVQIFLGNGDGTFRTGSNLQFSTGVDPVFVATGDFNGDGFLDLAIANQTDNTVSILLGNGDGTFTPASIPAPPVGNTPTSIAVADLNVDGRPDLLVTDKADNAMSILLNLGNALFGPNLELPVDTGPVSVASADFNGDGIPDAVTANNTANDVTVTLNSSTFSGLSNPLANTPFPGVEYLDIGLKVKATPRIHPGDEVTLQLNFDISSLTGQSFNNIPVISTQAVEQTVRLKENETATLAGFLQAELTNTISGTPGIADIPGAGLIASTITPQNMDSELLILVTPRLVRLSERKDHLIYAGKGAPEGTAAGAVGGTQVVPAQGNLGGVPPPAPQQPPVGGPPPDQQQQQPPVQTAPPPTPPPQQ